MQRRIRILALVLAVVLLAGVAPLPVGFAAKATDDSRYLAYYAPVINNYKAVIKNDFYRNTGLPNTLPKYVSEVLVSYKNTSNLSESVYYALYDVNGNGFPELVIGTKDDDYEEFFIYSVFSYSNKIHQVTETAGVYYKARADIFTSGTVVEIMRNGFAGRYWTFTKLNKKDQPKCVDTLTYDGVDGEKYFRAENKEITKQQAEKLYQKYTGRTDIWDDASDVTLPWKRINDLPEISALAKPTGLKVSSANTTALNLRWNKVKGAKGYAVYCYDTAARKYVKVAATHKTVVKITDLTPGTTYRFAVRAYSKPAQKYLYSGYSSVLRAATA